MFNPQLNSDRACESNAKIGANLFTVVCYIACIDYGWPSRYLAASIQVSYGICFPVAPITTIRFRNNRRIGALNKRFGPFGRGGR